jgi:DNA-3-methyladenine glycosylase II
VIGALVRWRGDHDRVRIVQAARLRADLIARHGEDGAFPSPRALRRLDPDLPGRKTRLGSRSLILVRST